MTAVDLIEIFEDTQKMFHRNPYLWIQTQRSKAKSILYPEHHTSRIRGRKGNMDVIVQENTSFRCAGEMVAPGTRVAVLNFANPHEPGGGVRRGANAQEECLCRCSNLYDVLNQPRFLEQYYGYHIRQCDELFSDRVIYSPDIKVIKSDDRIPKKLNQAFFVDVITCAAPYIEYPYQYTEQELLPVYEARIRNILEVAMDQNVDILILGAFGCGAFRNDPEWMASAFHRILIEEKYAAFFTKVIFAIKSSSYHCPNLYAFRKAFQDCSRE